jgi:hypothetical protein
MTERYDRFVEAMAPLSWGFSEGDDGDLLRLALDEIESILRELRSLRDSAAGDLPELLKQAGATDETIELVEELYKIGTGGMYGAGMGEDEAERATDLAQDACTALEALWKSLTKKKQRTAQGSTRKKTKGRTKRNV